MAAAKWWRLFVGCWLMGCSVVSPQTRAGDTDLRELAGNHYFTDPLQARYSQYRILSGMQELSALSDQEDGDKRLQHTSAALATIGKSYRQLGMPVLAAFYIDQALQVDPESSQLKAELGTLMVLIGEEELARRLLSQSAQAEDTVEQRRSVAVSWVLLGEYRKASELLRDLIRKPHSTVDSQYAWLLDQALLPLLAENSKAGKAPANNSKDWPGLLIPLQQQADESTLANYLRQVQLEDSDRFREQLCEALFFRAMYWRHQGQRERAQAYFSAVLQMNLPTFPETQLARYFLQLDQPVQPAARGASMDPMPIS